MKVLLWVLAASTTEAPDAGKGTQDAFDSALWQFPVAALVIFVVIYFLRHLKKEREAFMVAQTEAHESQKKEREAQQKFLSDTNQLDREAREKEQKRFTDSLQAVQARGDNTQRVMVDTFTKTQTEATKNSTALTARAIDTIDRNTEAFGEVKALLRETSNQLRAVPAPKKPDDGGS